MTSTAHQSSLSSGFAANATQPVVDAMYKLGYKDAQSDSAKHVKESKNEKNDKIAKDDGASISSDEAVKNKSLLPFGRKKSKKKDKHGEIASPEGKTSADALKGSHIDATQIHASSNGRVVSSPPKVSRIPISKSYGGDFSNGKDPVDLTQGGTPIENSDPQYSNVSKTVDGEGAFFDPRDTQGGVYREHRSSSEHQDDTLVKSSHKDPQTIVPGGVAIGEYGKHSEATQAELKNKYTNEPAASLAGIGLFSKEDQKELETELYNAGRRQGAEDSKSKNDGSSNKKLLGIKKLFGAGHSKEENAEPQSNESNNNRGTTSARDENHHAVGSDLSATHGKFTSPTSTSQSSSTKQTLGQKLYDTGLEHGIKDKKRYLDGTGETSTNTLGSQSHSSDRKGEDSTNRAIADSSKFLKQNELGLSSVARTTGEPKTLDAVQADTQKFYDAGVAHGKKDQKSSTSRSADSSSPSSSSDDSRGKGRSLGQKLYDTGLIYGIKEAKKQEATSSSVSGSNKSDDSHSKENKSFYEAGLQQGLKDGCQQHTASGAATSGVTNSAKPSSQKHTESDDVVTSRNLHDSKEKQFSTPQHSTFTNDNKSTGSVLSAVEKSALYEAGVAQAIKDSQKSPTHKSVDDATKRNKNLHDIETPQLSEPHDSTHEKTWTELILSAVGVTGLGGSHDAHDSVSQSQQSGIPTSREKIDAGGVKSAEPYSTDDSVQGKTWTELILSAVGVGGTGTGAAAVGGAQVPKSSQAQDQKLYDAGLAQGVKDQMNHINSQGAASASRTGVTQDTRGNSDSIQNVSHSATSGNAKDQIQALGTLDPAAQPTSAKSHTHESTTQGAPSGTVFDEKFYEAGHAKGQQEKRAVEDHAGLASKNHDSNAGARSSDFDKGHSSRGTEGQNQSLTINASESKAHKEDHEVNKSVYNPAGIQGAIEELTKGNASSHMPGAYGSEK